MNRALTLMEMLVALALILAFTFRQHQKTVRTKWSVEGVRGAQRLVGIVPKFGPRQDSRFQFSEPGQSQINGLGLPPPLPHRTLPGFDGGKSKRNDGQKQSQSQKHFQQKRTTPHGTGSGATTVTCPLTTPSSTTWPSSKRPGERGITVPSGAMSANATGSSQDNRPGRVRRYKG